MKILKKSSENEHFYSREILLYIAWACLRNDFMKMQRLLPHSFNSLITSNALVYVDQQLHSKFSCKHEKTLKLKEFPSLLNYF